MESAKPKPRIFDNVEVRETYSNKLIGTAFDGGSLSITLGTSRFIPDRIDDPPRNGQHPGVYVTDRIAISPACAVEVVNALNHILSVMAATGNPHVSAVKPTAPPATH
jgi:hypothetical protein